MLANSNNCILDFNVIDLLFTKSSKYLVYNLVFLNHNSNFFELLVKKNKAKRKNGVVGSIGIIIPILPTKL